MPGLNKYFSHCICLLSGHTFLFFFCRFHLLVHKQLSEGGETYGMIWFVPFIMLSLVFAPTRLPVSLLLIKLNPLIKGVINIYAESRSAFELSRVFFSPQRRQYCLMTGACIWRWWYLTSSTLRLKTSPSASCPSERSACSWPPRLVNLQTRCGSSWTAEGSSWRST